MGAHHGRPPSPPRTPDDDWHAGLPPTASKDSQVFLMVGLGAFLAFLIGACLGGFCASRRRRRAEAAALERKLDTIITSLDQDGPSSMLQYPFVLMRAQDFITNGRIMSYQDVRRAGQQIVLDSIDQLKQFERKEV